MQGPDQRLKMAAAFLEVRVLIERGAGRRQEDDISAVAICCARLTARDRWFSRSMGAAARNSLAILGASSPIKRIRLARSRIRGFSGA